jgi:sigma-E factor negative regulatory protein RseA
MREIERDKELVSALVDGQLRTDELTAALDWMQTAPDAQLTWRSYHLVGESLRSPDRVSPVHAHDFLARLNARIQEEPGHTSVLKIQVEPQSVSMVDAQTSANRSANDGAMRWKLIAGITCFSFVVPLIWQLSTGFIQEANSVALGKDVKFDLAKAKVVSQAISPNVQSVMIRNSELDALVSAHRQFGGSTALQVPSGFIRNATFEGAMR